MPFGKHRGVPLAEIEADYLKWAATADRMTPELRDAIATELATRAPVAPKPRDRHKVPSAVSEEVQALAELIVRAGHDALAEGFGMNHDFARAHAWLLMQIATTPVDDADFPF